MDGVVTYHKNGVRTIRIINKPNSENALSIDSYIKITTILNEDAKSNDTTLTIIIGTADCFTSGNDMKETGDTQKSENPQHCMLDHVNIFVKFFSAMINYPKILVAVVNGPAVGVGVTMIGLCDVAYASDTATFHTPFVNLAACAEACANYNFPRFMGRSKGGEMLLLGHKMSAQEALQFGLVSKVVPHDNLDELYSQLEGYGNLPMRPVRINRELISENLTDKMFQYSNGARDTMKKLFISEEFVNGFMQFMTRKNKI